MAVAQALSTISLLIGAPTMAQPDQSLDITVVDTSAFPTVVIDLVVPLQYSATEITEAMLDVDGEPVDSVELTNPGDVVMALILDDRPAIDADVVTAQQSGAVELARNVGDGTEIALATPSGLRTAFTTDREATIARVAGITAGAPDVAPLADLIIDSVALLAASDRTDRHLVVELGSTPNLSEQRAQLLSDALAASGTRLHVVAAPAIDVSPLDELAERSGGSASAVAETVAGSDKVTAAITNRYRIVATVDGSGPHEFGLDVDGQRLASTIDVNPVAPPATPAPSTAPTTPDSPTSAAGKEKQSAPAADASAASTAPVRSTAPALAPSRPADASSDSRPVPIIAGLIVLLAAAAMAHLLVRRQRRRLAAAKLSRVSTSPVVAAAADPQLAPAVAERLARTPQRIAVARAHRGREEQASRRTPRTSDPMSAEGAVERGGDDSQWLVSGRLRMCPATGEVLMGRRRANLDPRELRVLQLLITKGGKGLTAQSIVEAAGLEFDGDDQMAANAIITQVRLKTGMRGRGQTVRHERVLTYFFGDTAGEAGDPTA